MPVWYGCIGCLGKQVKKVFQEENDWDCSGGPVVEYLRCNAGGADSILGQGT